VVRQADASDSAGATALLVGSGWAGAALPPQLVLANAAQFGAAFVATGEGEQEPVGFVRIISDRSTVSYVAELVTAAGWRGRGVARALIEACMGQFPTARLDLLSTEMALGFYERTGFAAKPGYRRWPS
jgi:GNAT superfamily N-acetyltransferase